jgi:flagellar basal body rod protein FlgG
LNAKGVVLRNPAGEPVLAEVLADAVGSIALAADGKPLVGQPFLANNGQKILSGNVPVYVGAVGVQASTFEGKQIKTSDGLELQFGYNGLLTTAAGKTIAGSDGRPVILSSRGMLLAPNGDFLLDRIGKPCRINNRGQIIDSENKPVLNISGKPIIIASKASQLILKVKKEKVVGPNGKAIKIAPNGQVFDENANPVLTSSGSPIYVDGKRKTLVDAAGKPIKIGKGAKSGLTNQIVGKVGKLTVRTA